MPSRRLIPLLCLLTAANTLAIGAFPALLPEVARTAGLADWQLGTVAGAWGFTRMLTDVPVGLFVTHRLRSALSGGPLLVLAGVVIVATGGPFGVLVLGRAVMGVGHALTMVAGLTAILRFHPPGRLASSLNAVEFSAMLGMIAGITLVGALPTRMAWSSAYLLACAPSVAGVACLPWLVRALPAPAAESARPLFARSEDDQAAVPPASGRGLVVLAFSAGGAIALTYAMVEQFLVPVRGSRELGLDRVGITRLLTVINVCDTAALLPVGALADRLGTARVLGVVLLSFAVGIACVGFGGLSVLVVGCVLLGVSMAGWMLPLGVLRAVTAPGQIAWRTALYRVSVDGGIFLGPFLSGLLAGGASGTLPAAMSVVLAAVGLCLLFRRTPRQPGT